MNKIMGPSQVSAEHMKAYLLSKNPNPKINMDLLEFCRLFLVEGASEGVRGDIAFCQSIKETGWFRYGKQVLTDQNNYSGIGATNNSPVGKGAWFKSPQEGIRAQIQHLKGYASQNKLRYKCVDPRYHLLTLGCAPNWENLNNRWAVPGKGYGEDIMRIYNDMFNFKSSPINEESANGIINFILSLFSKRD